MLIIDVVVVVIVQEGSQVLTAFLHPPDFSNAWIELLVVVCNRWKQNDGRKWCGGRGPMHSVNFVTAHDGFSLADLVTYNEKKNDANGENSNDGEDHNNSWNCGVEGRTSNETIQVRICVVNRRIFFPVFMTIMKKIVNDNMQQMK